MQKPLNVATPGSYLVLTVAARVHWKDGLAPKPCMVVIIFSSYRLFESQQCLRTTYIRIMPYIRTAVSSETNIPGNFYIVKGREVKVLVRVVQPVIYSERPRFDSQVYAMAARQASGEDERVSSTAVYGEERS